MKRVTLSFDNGPTPGVTERVLDILLRAGIRATFFVIGGKLEDPAAAALMRAAHAGGHWVGNHTLTHSIAFGDRLDAAYAALGLAAAFRQRPSRLAFAHRTESPRRFGRIAESSVFL